MGKQPILTPQAQDFPRWYQDVIAKAELVDNGPVRGTMVIRPYGFAIWELLQAESDRRIKAAGANNAYFPLFIPESFLKKEEQHVEGFSPELAVVTHGGGKKLDEPAVVRPTSETIINHFFAKWVHSYRDLPLLINQWCNVVRWELRPRLFLRTTEFLWQEGHTAHATEQDAREYALQILRDVYTDTMVNVMGVPVLPGKKTAAERFAGATNTWACEAMMRDGKALQMATSHELGQNFAKAFDIRFSNADETLEYAWQTSWGSSTRMIGGLIMTHGDDAGLRLPPALAPIQVVIVVVRDDTAVVEAAHQLGRDLTSQGIRINVDNRTDQSFGRRSVEWEIKGVPIRIEVGPRDLEQGMATVVRRDLLTKEQQSIDDIATAIPKLLEDIQASLLGEATQFRDERITDVTSKHEAIDAAQGGFARIPWSVLGEDGERELGQKAITVRCLQTADGRLPLDAEDKDEDIFAIVGRSY